MRIALLGGTGDIGEGLALRWAYDTDHRVVVGSRDPEKAHRKVTEYESELDTRGRAVTMEGYQNSEAAAGADVVIASVPAYHLVDTIEGVADQLDPGSILVSPAVGMKRDESGMHYNPPGAGSVTALAADAAPADVPVVGAFHNLAAARLADLDATFEWDTFLVAEDEGAKRTVGRLAEDINGLRALDAGGLANAPEVEGLTPLLVNLAHHNEGLHDLGIRVQ